MENNETAELIKAFKEYRDLLAPVQENLGDFIETYSKTNEEITKLNEVFGSDLQSNLDKIYKTLAAQAERSQELSSRIERFSRVFDRFGADMAKVVSVTEKMEERIAAVNRLEQTAEEQIGKLEEIIEEKRKSYNIKELQRALEGYNQNVQKMSEFINRDVAEAISANNRILTEMKAENAKISERLESGSVDMKELFSSFSASSELIRKAVENEAVNEQYVFDILDKWAESRKVKIRK